MNFRTFFVFFVFLLSIFAENDSNETLIVLKIPSRPALDQPNSKSSQFQNVREMGIFFCQIPKNGATIMKVVLCDLYRYFIGISFKPQFTHDKQLSECQYQRWYKDTKNKHEQWKRNGEETRLAIIRHPFTRFLSLYRYLCEHIKMCGANPDIHKFTRDVYTLLSTSNIDGTAFTDREKETIEYHSQPQTWFCNLASSRNQFQLVHNDGDRLMMRSELQKAFDVANVPKRFADQVLFHIVYSDTSHSNHDETRTKQLKVDMEQSPQTMEYFNAIYYKDFELLGY